ncbi:type I-E CRISPR-associated protein Cas6/Cse3/CasE [Streptomyces netropsis]
MAAPGRSSRTRCDHQLGHPRPFPRSTRNLPGPHHHLTQFDGTARITDPDLLTTALHTGIGKGKPYGAGLLSLTSA